MKQTINLISSMVIVMLMALSCASDKKEGENNDSDRKYFSDVEEELVEDQPIEVEEEEIIVDESEKQLPMIVDFYADWCGPCQKMKPIFSQLEEEYSGIVDFGSVNIDEESELAAEYQVESIPTFIFIDAEGNIVNRVTGSMDKDSFENEIITAFGL